MLQREHNLPLLNSLSSERPPAPPSYNPQPCLFNQHRPLLQHHRRIPRSTYGSRYLTWRRWHHSLYYFFRIPLHLRTELTAP